MPLVADRGCPLQPHSRRFVERSDAFPGLSGDAQITRDVGAEADASHRLRITGDPGVLQGGYPHRLRGAGRLTTPDLHDLGVRGDCLFPLTIAVQAQQRSTLRQRSGRPLEDVSEMGRVELLRPSQALPDQIGQATVAGGTGSFHTDALAVGDHQITAQFVANSDFNGSTSDQITQTVGAVDTTTVVESNHLSSVFGQDVTFTAQMVADRA